MYFDSKVQNLSDIIEHNSNLMEAHEKYSDKINFKTSEII